jgi:hypothetical protein
MARERRVEERTDGAATAQPQEEAPTWHALSPAETADRLGTGASGLTAEDAAVRLTRHGPNEVEPERPTPWPTLLLRQFQDPLIYILLIAAAVTLALRDYADSRGDPGRGDAERGDRLRAGGPGAARDAGAGPDGRAARGGRARRPPARGPQPRAGAGRPGDADLRRARPRGPAAGPGPGPGGRRVRADRRVAGGAQADGGAGRADAGRRATS